MKYLKNSSPIVALLTDFGEKDWFVAAMRGVIKSIFPSADLVDVSHEIQGYNIRSAAFILAASCQYFPAGTIFCCVVDPGVGSARNILAATDGRFFYVAPDNGLLSMVAANAGETWQMFEVQNRKFMLPEISHTFHGRDIFAPVAAHLAGGHELHEMGPQITEFVELAFPEPRAEDHALRIQIIYIDRFGNLFTNLKKEHLLLAQNLGPEDNWILRAGNNEITGMSATFIDQEAGKPLFYWGSCGYLEIAINKGNAHRQLGLDILDVVYVEKGDQSIAGPAV